MQITHFLQIYFVTAFFSITINTFAQSDLQHTNQTESFDSIAQSIFLSKVSDSLKIHNLNSLIAKDRYVKHTKYAINITRTIAYKSKNKSLIADSYRSLGNYYFYNSQLDSAEFFLLKSKKIATNLDTPFIKAAIGNALAGVYRKKGNMTQAMSSILESKTILESIDTSSLSIATKRKLVMEQLISFNTLANFHNQMGNFSQALDNYDKAYENTLLLNATNYAGVILSNKGDLLLNNNKFEESLLVLIKAKELKSKGNAQESSIANTNQNISLAQLKTNQYDLALININKALNYYEKTNTELGLMEAYVIRGRILFMKKAYQNAIDDCSKSKELATKKGVLETQEKAFLCLSESYEALDDFENSLAHYKLYKEVKDSIFNQKNIKKITQLEMQYQYDKEKELQDLKMTAAEKESNDTIRSLFLGIISLLLISGLLFRLFYIRQKANETLKEKNKKISETLAINEVLLKETHHRVKNNLQIISSLLNMQSKFLVDKKSKEIVIESQNRIKSMSLIHQKLYQENNVTGIETKTYLTDLITYLAHSYGIDFKKVKMNISIENILLDVDTAIPLGLLLNEIITNAFKHGVDKENGVFSFKFLKLNEEQLLLTIKDNGLGIPEDFDWNKSKSYGMKLIQTLSKKLKANIKFENDNGLKISMNITRFKLL